MRIQLEIANKPLVVRPTCLSHVVSQHEQDAVVVLVWRFATWQIFAEVHCTGGDPLRCCLNGYRRDALAWEHFSWKQCGSEIYYWWRWRYFGRDASLLMIICGDIWNSRLLLDVGRINIILFLFFYTQYCKSNVLVFISLCKYF